MIACQQEYSIYVHASSVMLYAYTHKYTRTIVAGVVAQSLSLSAGVVASASQR